ncbi:MAG: hypothetical protein R3F60_29490 [bacterium]
MAAALAPSTVTPSLVRLGDLQRPAGFSPATDGWSAIDPSGRTLSSALAGQASELEADTRYSDCNRFAEFPFDFTTDEVYRPSSRGICMQWRNPTALIGSDPPVARAVRARWEAYGLQDWTSGLVATGYLSFSLAGGDAPTADALAWSRFEVNLAEAGGLSARDFFVVVQALDADDRPGGPRSNPIAIHWLQASDEAIFPPIDQVDLHHPDVVVRTFSGLRPTPCPDAENRYLINEPGPQCAAPGLEGSPWCVVGTAVRWVPSDDEDCGFLPDVVCEVVGGAVDFFASIVDGISAAYDGILAVASNFLVVLIEAAGVDCDATCQAITMAAVQVGAAALGLPPSLPDFDALIEDGFDYLVSECGAFVADATGAPQVLTDEACGAAVDAMRDAVREAKAEATAGMMVVPDPAWQALPAQASLRFANPTDAWSVAVRLELQDEAGILAPVRLRIPPLAPGAHLDAPVVFAPYRVNLPGETGSPMANWSRRASAGPVRLRPITTSIVRVGQEEHYAPDSLYQAVRSYDVFGTAPACP